MTDWLDDFASPPSAKTACVTRALAMLALPFAGRNPVGRDSGAVPKAAGAWKNRSPAYLDLRPRCATGQPGAFVGRLRATSARPATAPRIPPGFLLTSWPRSGLLARAMKRCGLSTKPDAQKERGHAARETHLQPWRFIAPPAWLLLSKGASHAHIYKKSAHE